MKRVLTSIKNYQNLSETEFFIELYRKYAALTRKEYIRMYKRVYGKKPDGIAKRTCYKTVMICLYNAYRNHELTWYEAWILAQRLYTHLKDENLDDEYGKEALERFQEIQNEIAKQFTIR